MSASLLDLPELAIVETAKYLYGSHKYPQSAALRRLSHTCKHLRAVLRDHVNVCQILSSPFLHFWGYDEDENNWGYANLFIRLSCVPLWLVVPGFVDDVVGFVKRHDDRSTSLDRKFGAPYAVSRAVHFCLNGPMQTQEWAVASTRFITMLLAHFWSDKFVGPLASMTLTRDTFTNTPENARSSGVPLAHYYYHRPWNARVGLWEAYGRKGAHPKDIVMLIDIMAGYTHVSKVREELDRSEYDPVETAQMAKYFYPTANRRLQIYLETLFPDAFRK